MMYFLQLNIFMFTTTSILVNPLLVIEAAKGVNDLDCRLAVNRPSGSFFYDPWIVKEEFKNTVWEQLLRTLPHPIGEARIIKLDPGTCYRSHSDIDDRWHLSIIAEKSYLVNLDTEVLYPQTVDNIWYFFDAGGRHSAVNFGSKPRFQMVVRKLLERGNAIINPTPISITLKTVADDGRYIFDDIVSPWLNEHSKKQLIDDFQYKEFEVRFTTDASVVSNLRDLISDYFNLKIIE